MNTPFYKLYPKTVSPPGLEYRWNGTKCTLRDFFLQALQEDFTSQTGSWSISQPTHLHPHAQVFMTQKSHSLHLLMLDFKFGIHWDLYPHFEELLRWDPRPLPLLRGYLKRQAVIIANVSNVMSGIQHESSLEDLADRLHIPYEVIGDLKRLENHLFVLIEEIAIMQGYDFQTLKNDYLKFVEYSFGQFLDVHQNNPKYWKGNLNDSFLYQ